MTYCLPVMGRQKGCVRLKTDVLLYRSGAKGLLPMKILVVGDGARGARKQGAI